MSGKWKKKNNYEEAWNKFSKLVYALPPPPPPNASPWNFYFRLLIQSNYPCCPQTSDVRTSFLVYFHPSVGRKREKRVGKICFVVGVIVVRFIFFHFSLCERVGNDLWRAGAKNSSAKKKKNRENDIGLSCIGHTSRSWSDGTNCGGSKYRSFVPYEAFFACREGRIILSEPAGFMHSKSGGIFCFESNVFFMDRSFSCLNLSTINYKHLNYEKNY